MHKTEKQGKPKLNKYIRALKKKKKKEKREKKKKRARTLYLKTQSSLA